jgi:rRNA biogenesis protein RRP5
VKGYVFSISQKGCFLRLSDTLVGRALLRDLSDNFIENPSEEFPLGKLVVVRVIKVDYVNGFVQLSAKSSLLEANGKLSFEAKQIVSGTVRRVTDFGVFVDIENSSVVGLARKNFCYDDKNEHHKLSDDFEVGDIVKACILSVSPDSKKVALDLRQSSLLNTNNQVIFASFSSFSFRGLIFRFLFFFSPVFLRK